MLNDSMVQNCPTSDFDPWSDESIFNRNAFYEQLREEGPVHWLNKYGAYCVSRYAETVEVLSDSTKYCSSGGAGLANLKKADTPFRPPSLLLETDPPEHERFRIVVARAMSPANLRKLRDMVEKGASAVVDKVAQLKTFDAVSDLAEPFVIDVFPNAIGLSQEGRENLLPYGAMILNAFGPANDILAASAHDRVALTEWLMKSCRRENLMPGGIGAEIYGAVDRGEITESEAPMLMRSLLGGGLDTTVYGIANLVWCFARYPTEWDKVKADPTRIRVAIDEATRLLPVLLTPFRTTTRAVKLAGVEIAENEKILLLIGSANRDPRRWQDPDVFNVDRKVTGHVGFGAGVHGCIGQMISKMETEVLMQTFVKVVKRIAPAGDAPVLRHNTIGSFSSVPVRVETENA